MRKNKQSLKSVAPQRTIVKTVLSESRRPLLSFDTMAKLEVAYFTPYRRALPIESDRRLFRPDLRQRRILKIDSTASRLTSRGKFDKINFAEPYKEFPCAKRQARRRVLFALRLTGKGASAKRHNFTELSKISCKG